MTTTEEITVGDMMIVDDGVGMVVHLFLEGGEEVDSVSCEDIHLLKSVVLELRNGKFISMNVTGWEWAEASVH